MNLEQLKAAGYARTSNKHRNVSRIDRPDWREFMAKQHAPWNPKEGMEWVEYMGKSAADHYRRVYSKDDLVLPLGSFKQLPPSDMGPTQFREKV